ncbi:hypoxia-inducible factor 1-alpha [Nephila pilipes]|uniref:Hypoxia-inducible factor 1-alpha n=1 Tax=Nephila pilipes TaxID=299642 RepID=A0A8X6M7I7_NEPPI|nr:hypoxia-inducible factor 1-alpha [Nephila pilipes]
MCGGKVAIPPIVKEKRRNSEKRKEKSRDAARYRRSKESEIFNNLSGQLPLPQGAASALDKTSVMRVTVGYLKIREMMRLFKSSIKNVSDVSPLDSLSGTHLDGFLLVLSEEGDVVYLSENVEQFIGISQVEMLGQSLYEFSHPCDHDEIKAILTTQVPLKDDGSNAVKDNFSIFVRMKSTIKTRGRAVNLKSATYQVIHYIGHKLGKPERMVNDKCPAFVALIIGQPIPHPAHIDVPLDKDIFISRHSPDMKFTHIDERITEFLGYKSSELIGKSAYSFYHALDISSLIDSFKTSEIEKEWGIRLQSSERLTKPWREPLQKEKKRVHLGVLDSISEEKCLLFCTYVSLLRVIEFGEEFFFLSPAAADYKMPRDKRRGKEIRLFSLQEKRSPGTGRMYRIMKSSFYEPPARGLTDAHTRSR